MNALDELPLASPETMIRGQWYYHDGSKYDLIYFGYALDPYKTRIYIFKVFGDDVIMKCNTWNIRQMVTLDANRCSLSEMITSFRIYQCRIMLEPIDKSLGPLG